MSEDPLTSRELQLYKKIDDLYYKFHDQEQRIRQLYDSMHTIAHVNKFDEAQQVIKNRLNRTNWQGTHYERRI